MIVSHLIEREYKSDINQSLGFADQLVELAKLFRQRLTSLVANWLRVGCARVILTRQLRWRLYPDYGLCFCENLTLGFNLGLVAAAFHSSISPLQQKQIITCLEKQ